MHGPRVGGALILVVGSAGVIALLVVMPPAGLAAAIGLIAIGAAVAARPTS
jgi:hypothetical protein